MKKDGRWRRGGRAGSLLFADRALTHQIFLLARLVGAFKRNSNTFISFYFFLPFLFSSKKSDVDLANPLCGKQGFFAHFSQYLDAYRVTDHDREPDQNAHHLAHN